MMTRPSGTLPQQGYEELLGVALLGQGDELRLELLTHLLVECREQLLAHHLLNRHHLFRRELLQQRLGEGRLGLFIHLVLLGMRVAEPDETRADARLRLIVFLVVKLVVQPFGALTAPLVREPAPQRLVL